MQVHAQQRVQELGAHALALRGAHIELHVRVETCGQPEIKEASQQREIESKKQ